MGGVGHRRRKGGIRRETVFIGPQERIIGEIKKDIREQFNPNELMVEKYFDGDDEGVYIQFPLTSQCRVTLKILSMNLEGAYRAHFGEKLIRKLMSMTFDSEMLRKLLPVLNHYAISFKRLASLWKSHVELVEVESLLWKKSITWQSSSKHEANKQFTELIGASLFREESIEFEKHMSFFQILYQIGDTSIQTLKPDRKSLLLMQSKEYNCLEIISTKSQRFHHYFNHPSNAFRSVFMQLWREEVIFTIWICSELYLLPELMPLIVMKWTNLFLLSIVSEEEKGEEGEKTQ